MAGMEENLQGTERGHGLISLFVRHPTGSNLLMAVMILIGVFALLRLNTQFFPTIAVPVITVNVVWSGASAEDVEKNILDALEPELRFLDDVDDVTSIAREGAAVITPEFNADADMQKAQSDVEQAVARITTLPDDAEEAKISQATFYEGVASIAVSGPVSEDVLKSYAKQLRDGLLKAGIDRVSLTGARDEEIWVRVREQDLRRYDLTISDLSSRIRDNTRDQPSGIVEGAFEVQLRSESERTTPEELARIEIKALPSGERILLRDVASVETSFARDGQIGLLNGQPAIEMNVQRAVSADTLKTMKAMETYIAGLRPTLPPGLQVEVYDIKGKLVVQRLGILISNGIQGLVIVLLVLFIFLNARIAFWVAAGIPVAFMATLAVMYVSGQTINMISMFALIMMLGIIVDDAIVVGEHTATRQALGDSAIDAAERGAGRMLMPVLAATLTTQAAFFPIFLIQDRIGDMMSAIPLVVSAVLVASVIECFFILPGHLRHAGAALHKQPGWFRRNFDRGLDRFRDGPFNALASLAYNWRYTTVAVTIAALIVSFGVMAGGRVGFTFFPAPEGEQISAHVFFGAGTPRAEQLPALARLEETLLQAEREILGEMQAGRPGLDATAAQAGTALETGASPVSPSLPNAEISLSERMKNLVFGPPDTKPETKLIESRFTILGVAGRSQGDNLAQITVQLTPSEERTVPTKRIIDAWRRNLPEIAGVERVSISSPRGGPPGRDLDVRLQDGPVESLKRAAEDVKVALTGFTGVSGVSDDLPYGKPEMVLELTPRGAALGFTGQSVGTQVRNAFEGAIATRFARGDEEITVRVKYNQGDRGMSELRQMFLRSPQGLRVPLSEIVSIREKVGFSVIQRREGVRTVSVTGDIDSERSSVAAVVDKLRNETMPEIAARHGVSFAFSGRDEEQGNSFRDLRLGAMLAMALIFIILAWVFASYAAPLAVMAIIPFGLVGAILGHYAMGIDLTIVSMIGLLGLSGILVNDSIILVTQVQDRLKAGDTLAGAAVGASRDRLRAVLLTSLTTIGGLLPLLFETSRQAQFLIPMAVTIVFGLATATVLVLLLVPALVGIGGDIGRIAGWFKALGAAPSPRAGQS